MKASNPHWREQVVEKMSPQLTEELDQFETEIHLKKQGKLDDRVFAETRLRRGAYGQRYDNGRRHDGTKTQSLEFPCGSLSKGPGTAWDAPGMLRIKIPYGGLNAPQLEVLGELAEEYSDGIAHVTTRQCIQLHFIHIDDAPTIMRRLAAVGITTREACGNSVRNVTACPFSGICTDEAFDVTPYAHALTYHLLGHPDCQNFGRKFKPAFSGCKDQPCGLVKMHDVGYIATTREVDGQTKRGFEMYVGGGLGAVPRQAKVLSEFVTEEEFIPLTQAVARVFGRLGEKKNRGKARIKFLVDTLGIDEFRRLVMEERAVMEPEASWTSYLDDLTNKDEKPLRASGENIVGADDPDFQKWSETNLYQQRQEGFVAVILSLPLGDITADQLRALSDIAQKYTNETIRTTVEQNILLRWVSKSDVAAVYAALKAAELVIPGAGTIVDVTSCPGTDTCKLGISSSRGLAAQLRTRLTEKSVQMDQAIKDLVIKVSGCFNSCSGHHVADMGFYGVSRSINKHSVPHFQVVLGGQFSGNAGAYGLPMGPIPSKRIPDVVDRLTQAYLERKEKDESFKDFVGRVGKAEIKGLIQDLTQVPSYDEDRSFYSDWGDPREFTKDDIGIGECAGEVVTAFTFDMTSAERMLFEAQLKLEKDDFQSAASLAVDAMVAATTGLLRLKVPNVAKEVPAIVEQFRKEYFETELFFDPYAGGKFGQYFLDAMSAESRTQDSDSVHRQIEEASLFVEACHSCSGRMSEQPANG
ncbi:nitrite/sulfite reductase [Verrucomicrobia bacterium]|jgi:sulfite reductase (ferredoxin)|nr:nitrite/sulfite reductase [Verrucomicrobiota bacterium]MDA7867325.1 nitrite/sulfite reductase [Verrucomicrobiota bacterium]